MSRIGKEVIQIPKGVQVQMDNGKITVSGPLGKLDYTIAQQYVKVSINDDKIHINVLSEDRESRSRHGLTRSLIANMISGVTEGFKKELQIIGVGYKAQVKGTELILNIGMSHPVVYSIPSNINIQVEGPTKIIISGPDKYKVGEVAATVRRYRPPEPYKGKGIRYIDEYVKRKTGKSGVVGGTGAGR